MNKELNIGRENAIDLPIRIGDNIVIVKQYYLPVFGKLAPKFDLHNPRLRSMIARENLPNTQETHERLLNQINGDLLLSFPVIKGTLSPIVMNSKKIIKDGNRRFATHRALAKDDPYFNHILVVELPDDVTEANQRLIIATIHCTGVKQWDSREKWKLVEDMIEIDGRSIEEVAKIIQSDIKTVENNIQANDWYREFDLFSSRQQTECQHKDPAKLYTYFAKLASKKKMRDSVMTLPDEKNKIFQWIYNGQFTDCLNMDNISRYWDNNYFQNLMSDGLTFKMAVKKIRQQNDDRRSADIPNDAKSLASRIKRMTNADKRYYKSKEAAKDKKYLKLLHKQLDVLFTEIEEDEVI